MNAGSRPQTKVEKKAKCEKEFNNNEWLKRKL